MDGAHSAGLLQTGRGAMQESGKQAEVRGLEIKA